MTITAGGRKQVAQRFGGGSYQSAADPRLHFGLGSATRIDRVEIRWPLGQVDRFEDVTIDNQYIAVEGARTARSHPAPASMKAAAVPVEASSRCVHDVYDGCKQSFAVIRYGDAFRHRIVGFAKKNVNRSSRILRSARNLRLVSDGQYSFHCRARSLTNSRGSGDRCFQRVGRAPGVSP